MKRETGNSYLDFVRPLLSGKMDGFRAELFGSNATRICSSALQTAIYQLNWDALTHILEFTNEQKILVHVSPANIKTLMFQ